MAPSLACRGKCREIQEVIPPFIQGGNPLSVPHFLPYLLVEKHSARSEWTRGWKEVRMGTKARILIVDDEVDFTQSLQKSLDAKDYQVTIVTNRIE
ncbi:MAG: hypothetical protein ACFFAK_17350, partial [Promethearchaeota archaeon]